MIHIDLRNLTQAHIDEARPSMGSCAYAGPCIIGTLVPTEERERLDTNKLGYGSSPNIRTLIAEGVIDMPWNQQCDALEMQRAFDDYDAVEFEHLAQKWIAA